MIRPGMAAKASASLLLHLNETGSPILSHPCHWHPSLMYKEGTDIVNLLNSVTFNTNSTSEDSDVLIEY